MTDGVAAELGDLSHVAGDEAPAGVGQAAFGAGRSWVLEEGARRSGSFLRWTGTVDGERLSTSFDGGHMMRGSSPKYGVARAGVILPAPSVQDSWLPCLCSCRRSIEQARARFQSMDQLHVENVSARRGGQEGSG